MDANERSEIGIKEFLSKVVKEERDFKIASKILDKQEAVLRKSNYFEKKEMEKIIEEEKTLKKKILAKSEAISKLEEAIRLKQGEKYNQIEQDRLEISWLNSNSYSGEPSVDIVAEVFKDSKDQGHRNEKNFMEHQSKFNGQKIVSGSVKNGGLGEVENSIFTPKDARVTPVVLKSILKNKLQSHGFIYQPYVNNEKIDKVAGSERRVNFKEKIGSGKASKIDCLAAADNRKITFEIDATGIEDKDMENNTISKLRDQNGETKKLKNNVEIGKAASKGNFYGHFSDPVGQNHKNCGP